MNPRPDAQQPGPAAAGPALRAAGLRAGTYMFAAAAIAATLLLWRLLVGAGQPDELLALMSLPIIVSAMLGGAGPGLLATGLAVSCVLAVVAAQHGLAAAWPLAMAKLATLTASGLLVSLMSQRLRTSLRKLEIHGSQLRALVDSTGDAIFVKDLRGRYQLVSPATARFLGKEVGEVLGRDDSQLLPEAAARQLRANDQAVMAGGATRTLEERFANRDGRVMHFLATKGPIRDAAGEVVGVFGISHDITERKRDEERLREQEELLSTMSSMTHAGGWSFDPATGRGTWTRECASIHGLPEDAPIDAGKGIEFICEEYRETIRAAIRDAVEHARPYDLELEIAPATGGRKWVRTIGAPVVRGGVVVRLHGAMQDISVRKRNVALLALQARRAQVLLELPRIAERSDEQELLEEVLAHAEELTASGISFMHFLESDEENIALTAWSARTARSHAGHVLERHHPVSRAGLWADAVRLRDAVVVNDYASAQERQGLPQGHAGLARLISVPLIDDGRVVVVAGVGNKPQDYDATDVETLQLLLSEVWRIVSRRRVERQLTKLSRAVEQSPESVLITDLDARIEFVNTAFERQTGYTLAQVRGRTPAILHSGNTPAGTAESMWAALRRGEPWSGEFRNRRKDGSEYIDFAHVSPIRREDGVVTHYVSVQEDVTERRRVERELVESESRYRSLFENMNTGFVMFEVVQDDRGVPVDLLILAANRGFETTTGLKAREVVGRRLTQVVPGIENDAADWIGSYAKVALSGEPVQFEQGSELLGVYYAVSAYQAAPGQCAVTFLDITQRRKAEERLQLAASIFNQAREGIMVTDVDGDIVEVNEAFSAITGYARDEVLGRNPRILKSDRQGREFYAAMWRELVERGHWSGEIWNRHKDTSPIALLESIGALRDSRGDITHYVSLFSDVTPLKEREHQLEYLAHYDLLTSLPNRVLLADRLHQAMAQTLRRGTMLGVAFLDLDGFKIINDRHGHQVGDRFLAAVAARLRQAVREGDTIARIGGDEFVVVLLDQHDRAEGMATIRRLLAAAAEEIALEELRLRLSASIGVTYYPQSEEVDADQLLRQADQAMYQAKLAGKNRCHAFNPDEDRSLRGHHEIVERLRKALNAREFVLHYQPKVNMRSGRLVGVEALLRWQHPERGLLGPALFLPEIEDHDLSVELGDWVLDTGLAQLRRWRAQGLDIGLSVNVSARQLQKSDFVERVRERLRQHPGVAAGQLELEVLETSALQDLAQVSGIINACKELGVSFALDDFGTGYSSLTYLKLLPAAVLKIDRSFVSGMLDDPEDLAILEGVMGMAAAFRRKVVAEGVETIEHGSVLLQLGCELAQGFGIARPMPADELARWASMWRPAPQWRTLPALASSELATLHAGVEHRAWARGIDAYVKGQRASAPTLDPRQCRFGEWLHTDALRSGWSAAELDRLERLHAEFHALGRDICEWHGSGNSAQAAGRLGELAALRDRLLERWMPGHPRAAGHAGS